jgi:3',5'-cyclic AMP phosphodiesterase CpdA
MLIAQVTDVHLGFEPNNPAEFNRQRLDQVIRKLKTTDPVPDMLIISGDLVDRGDIESYQRLRSVVDGCGFPVWLCLGNHDMRDNFSAVFPEIPLNDGFVQYEVETEFLRILLLDTLEEGRHGGAFCEERADWLNQQLSAKPNTPTLLVMHHPPVDVGIEWMATDSREPWVARFSDAIEGHNQVVAVICGHLHRPISSIWKGTSVIVCASSAPQTALDLSPIDAENPDSRAMIIADPPAYALHRWNGREMITHFDNADDHVVIARFDHKMQKLVRHLLEERPGAEVPEPTLS